MAYLLLIEVGERFFFHVQPAPTMAPLSRLVCDICATALIGSAVRERHRAQR